MLIETTSPQAIPSKALRPALLLKHVECAFPGNSPEAPRYVAVSDTTLQIGNGEFIALVGPTGCGKSSLLNVAAGLVAPTLGEVRVFDKPLVGLNRDAAYMFQADALLPWKNALDNVALGLTFRGESNGAAQKIARGWLQRVGLGAHAERYPHQLSGGMKKRVALAQILALKPKILLMDEPFSALDAQTRELMENELLALCAEDKKSVLFVTHDLEEAISLADRVVVLSAGPGCHPVGEFPIDLPRPRDVSEIRMTPHFAELHAKIWRTLKDEVMKAHRGANSAMLRD
ncbi:MAG: ABC transporter ATP-binding protein [Burkholderiales bacterium]